MNTSDGWRRRRVPEARGGAGTPRTPIDYAKVGRSSVRRRARGMTPGEAAAALADAELHAHLDRRDEAAADDGGRRAAELAEWQRIVQLLAATGGPYDPDADVVVQEELAEDRRRAEAEQQYRQEEQQTADRAAELVALAKAGRLDRTVASRPGDEAARALLDDRDYRVSAVDDWLAEALATRSGHYADPDTRAAAASLLPAPVRARAELLAVLIRTGAPVDGDLEFVGRLAQADPDATNALAVWLERALTAAPAPAGGGTA
ncbi:hypothetical protein ACIGFK_39540 [Streptomyces sp. NPDC085524]|uniref:hypothetical protein n=1 Tax=Streptomyces sp. NPDC085524 TaxID=3365728 RepID=UPI0037D84AF5